MRKELWEWRQLFRNSSTFQVKVMDQSNLLRDVNRRAMYRDEVLKEEFTKKDIQLALKKKWVTLKHIQPMGNRTMRKVVVFTLDEMPQRVWWKRVVTWLREKFGWA